MTTPTNSGRLRERMHEAAIENPFLRPLDAAWSVIEAEINKLNAENETLIDALNRGHRANARLHAEKAETIEVLESYWRDRRNHNLDGWWNHRAKPLLDKLKGSPDQTKPEAGKQDWIPYGSEFPSTEALGYGFKRQAPDQTKEGS